MTNVLSDYLFYASENEAPEMFHVWCGYGCIAAAVSRRVWMRIDDSEIYPNIYVILAGRAGNGKTWSLKKAKRIISELDLPYSASVETPQGMWRFMTGDPSNDKKPILPYGGAPHKLNILWPTGIVRPVHPMNIIASEFINFISLDEKVWINALNDIFDEDVYHYRTKNMGSDFIEGPCINLIGGLTLELLSALQKQDILNTGFGRRAIIQFGERKFNEPHDDPGLSSAQEEARARFLAHLHLIKSIPCMQMQMTPDAKLWWKNWYGPTLASVPSKPNSLQSWYATKSSILRKLGMLTSLAERLDGVIDVHHFEIPLAFLDRLEEGLYHIFGGVGKSDMGEVALKIYNWIASQEGPSDINVIKIRVWKELPHKRGWQTELQECLDQLVGEEKIRPMDMTVPGTSLSRRLYATPDQWTKYVADSGVEVVRQTDGAVNGSNLALAPSIDPLTVQPSTPQTEAEQVPTSSQLPASTVAVPLPILNPKKKD